MLFRNNIKNLCIFFTAISDSSYPSNASQPGILVKCNGTEKTLQACERHDIDSCKTVAGAQCRGILLFLSSTTYFYISRESRSRVDLSSS